MSLMPTVIIWYRSFATAIFLSQSFYISFHCTLYLFTFSSTADETGYANALATAEKAR
jgi:hypothetical protein